MFENIGDKIKKLVLFIFILEFVLVGTASIILCIVFEKLWLLLIAPVMIFLIWVGLLSFYALGELVDRVSGIDEKLEYLVLSDEKDISDEE